MALDLSADFALVDGLAPVGLFNPAGIQIASADALRRAISTKEALSSGGAYTTRDCRFHVANGAALAPVRPGWKVVDPVGTWTILEVGIETLTNRLKFVARNLALFYGLAETLVIEKATWAKNTSGAQVATWASETTLLGRVQLAQADSATEHGLRFQPIKATILLESQVLVTEQHRIKRADNSYLAIKGWTNPDTLGEVFQISGEVNPWPLN